MKIQFDQVSDRRNTGSLKWDFIEDKLGLSGDDLLPMWVSDYDFTAPPKVLSALQKRIEHGVFGYAERDSEYYDAVIRWYQSEYKIHVKKEWITTVHGVLPGLAMLIQLLTKETDKIVMQTPGYGSFRKITEFNNRILLENPLKEKNGKYCMDFMHLEKCFQDGAKVMILCNPHNPVGKAWSQSELTQVATLCDKYGVWLLCDEIWGDLVMQGNRYYSAMQLSPELQKRLVVATSASKTFGLSSMRISNFMIPNLALKERFIRKLDAHGMDVFDAMAMTAATAAYQTSSHWLKELKIYLRGNINYLNEFLLNEIPKAQMVIPEAGYLAWVNLKGLKLSDEAIENKCIKAGLVPSMGVHFGSGGAGHIRLNLGCPRSTLIKACERLKAALVNYF